MKVGPGTEEGVAIGPMINAAAIKKIEQHVADATRQRRPHPRHELRDAGARAVCPPDV